MFSRIITWVAMKYLDRVEDEMLDEELLGRIENSESLKNLRLNDISELNGIEGLEDVLRVQDEEHQREY